MGEPCGSLMKTTSFPTSLVPAVSCSSHRLFRAASLLVTVGALSVSLLAQNTTPADPNANPNGRTRRGSQNGNPADATGGNGGRGNFDPAAMQERMMTAMREQFGITDDAEWGLISERITKVSELRRATGGGGRGGFPGGGPGGPGGGGNRPPRTGATANPEQDSLRAAIADNLPDAEIKSRLERLRDSRKASEAKLTKAQEDLRAVLSVRQEAVAVMFGLLP